MIIFQQSGAIDLFIIKKFKEICFKLQWQLLEKPDMTAVDRARMRVSHGKRPNLFISALWRRDLHFRETNKTDL